MNSAIDPLKRSSELEPIASRGDERLYYRFRPARWYGGVATGDVCCCNLLCHFCWARDEVRARPLNLGRYHSPERAFRALDGIARRFGYHQLRLSGQEPTLGRRHLLRILELSEASGRDFILETNGLLIGAEADYAPSLAPFTRLHVRVSLKGTCEREFSNLTGADPGAFGLQLRALERLLEAGVECHPAVMVSFSPPERVRALAARLGRIDPSLAGEMEVEELILYPHVVRRLRRAGLDWRAAHEPGRVPARLV
ncbi:MAG: radical SAM protein [Thermoplasmatota archaeon]